MSLEWFSRMENAVRVSLPDVCEGFEDYDILFDTDTTEQHPAFLFSVDSVNGNEEFCIINFDPVNQEFYSYHFDEIAELQAKVLFNNLDQMLSFIHASFHEFMEEQDEDIEDDIDDDDEYVEVFDDDDYDYDEEILDSDEEDEDLEDVEWITNDKYISVEDHSTSPSLNLSIHYKLGVDQSSGDGVLLRNTIVKQGDEETEEEVIFYFREEEAGYIVDLVNQYIEKK